MAETSVWNIDPVSGIRYGVIPQHAVLQAWADTSELDYPDPACPECGGPVEEYADEAHAAFPRHPHWGGLDLTCPACRFTYAAEACDADEPTGSSYRGDGYLCMAGSDGDIFVMRAPYKTRAAFCSPCAPGAVYLLSPTDDGAWAYCFGHDWFDAGAAPYPVYDVTTEARVDAPGDA